MITNTNTNTSTSNLDTDATDDAYNDIVRV